MLIPGNWWDILIYFLSINKLKETMLRTGRSLNFAVEVVSEKKKKKSRMPQNTPY